MTKPKCPKCGSDLSKRLADPAPAGVVGVEPEALAFEIHIRRLRRNYKAISRKQCQDAWDSPDMNKAELVDEAVSILRSLSHSPQAAPIEWPEPVPLPRFKEGIEYAAAKAANDMLTACRKAYEQSQALEVK